MKTINMLVATILLGVSSCNSQNAKALDSYDTASSDYGSDYSLYVVPGEELVYCKSPTNIPTQLLYYASKQVVINVDVPDLAEPFTSYRITDVKNKAFSVNSDEFKTYVCVIVEKL